MAARYPTLAKEVYLPYARYLAESDRFEEAQIGLFEKAPSKKAPSCAINLCNDFLAYCKAGHKQEANEVLGHLAVNAVKENRFNGFKINFNYLLIIRHWG